MDSPLISALRDKQFDEVIRLIQDDNTDLQVADNHLVRHCCEQGYTDIIKILFGQFIHRVDPTALSNQALALACFNGHLEIVQLLLKENVQPFSNFLFRIKCYPSDGHYELDCNKSFDHPGLYDRAPVIILACHGGHVEIVKLLLQLGNYSDACYPAACVNGHLDVIKLLLDDKSGKLDPSCFDNILPTIAVNNGHEGIVRLLLSDEYRDRINVTNALIKNACAYRNYPMIEILCRDGRVDKRAGLMEIITVMGYRSDISNRDIGNRDEIEIYDKIINFLIWEIIGRLFFQWMSQMITGARSDMETIPVDVIGVIFNHIVILEMTRSSDECDF
jgi:ankyrin repeat protein